jgi:hypothetical protein
MKKLMIVAVLGAALVVPTQSDAWVAVARGGYYHPTYGACWHGGWGCGGVSTGTAVAAGVAGLAVGAAVGSAVARANTPTYVVAPTYATPYYGAPPPVYVAPGASIGSIYYSLPYGAQSAYINGAQYYVLNGSYYKPYFGNNGVYYQVVPNPI